MRADAGHWQGSVGAPQVANRLFGKDGDHQKTVTMAAISRASGVSQGAISSLLNGRDYGIRVSQTTRDRVFRICRELSYLPNDLRAIVRMYPELGDLCMLVPAEVGKPTADRVFEARMIDALRDAMAARTGSFSLATYQPDRDYTDQPEALPYPVRLGTATRILIVGPDCPSLVEALASRDLATISIGSSSTHSHVWLDYFSAGREAIRFLHSQGHRQIAMLSGPFGKGDPSAGALTCGVEAGYRDAGIATSDRNIIFGERTAASGANAVDVLWDRRRPTAIFCAGDAIAAGVMARAQELGAKVPRDLSVVGLGDEPMAALLSPPLTTFSLPYAKLAERSIEDLEKQNSGANGATSSLPTLPLTLVKRDSVAGIN